VDLLKDKLRLWFEMMALVEKVEMEVEDVTHQEISQEERGLESGSNKPVEQKKCVMDYMAIREANIAENRADRVRLGLVEEKKPRMVTRSSRSINARFPPELITTIFKHLPFNDLKNVLLVCRLWKKLGEQPCLWSSLKLRLPGNARSSLTRIKRVLNMGRLQPLLNLNPQLTLDFGQTKIYFSDILHFLQVLPPSVKKLSLEGEGLSLNWKLLMEMLEGRVDALVEELLKLEEVDFSKFSFFRNWAYSRAVLRRLTAVISSGEDVKLKVLSLPGFGPDFSDEALVKARGVGLQVNIFHFALTILVDDEDSGDDEDDEDGI